MLVEDRELTERAARIENLLAEVESFPVPDIRDKATEIVQNLLLLYGEGLERMLLAIERESDDEVSGRILAAFADDELVSHLLCLHDLHPVSVQTRVARALEDVRPYLASHGGNVELLGVEDGVARLRLQGSCSGCPSSTVTLKLAIEEAIHRAAPDLERIEAEGVTAPPPRPVAFLAASDVIKLKQKQTANGPAWTGAGPASAFPSDCLESRTVDGTPVLFIGAAENLYAYRDWCPGCSQSLERAALRGGEVTCPTCGHRYDIPGAGRCLDEPELHLDPLPLLVRNGEVKVALRNA